MKISTAYLSECGGREKNDDTVCVLSKEDGICAFVGDGLGGYQGGAEASQIAAKEITEYWKQEGLMTERQMDEAVRLADWAVKHLQQQKHGRMKTTMVTLVIEKQQARWMHVGDSRLYHFWNNKLIEQTMDHSVSQVAVLMGEIEAKDIRFHEDRNRVLRALGSENAKSEISNVIDISKGNHAFLLCTDGFWEYVYENEMEQLLEMAINPQKWLEEMKKLLVSRVPAKNDNFTAIAVFLEKIDR